MQTGQERVSVIFKLIVLHFIAISLVIFNFVPLKIGGVTGLSLMFDLMMVHYFSVYRNYIFSNWFLFLLGIWHDSLHALPLGVTSLTYIVAVKFFTIINQRLVSKSDFSWLWQQFIFFAVFISLIKWMILSLYHSQAYPLLPIIMQIIISSLIYPIMYKLFEYLNDRLVPWHD